MHPESVAFYTFGCRLNQAETAVLQRSFESKGYRVVNVDQPADVVVINTCTVTENGDADARRLVQRINMRNPGAKIALVGCQAQIQKEQLAHWANVRWVVGNAQKLDLATIVEAEPNPVQTQVIVPPIPRKAFRIPTAGIDRAHTRANLKIQDGCDFFCSFCEIPYARGRARSREFADILWEAQALVAAGHKELVLTGINLGTYDHEHKKIMDVIEALERIDGLCRIRISSIEPTTIPRELFQRMAQGSKLCRYLHVPLQSGSDVILKKMKRKYSIQEFQDFIGNVKKVVPEICLGTDCIVGFPGETSEDFAATVQGLEELPLSYLHVFSYSERRYAQSRLLPDPVAESEIRRRSRILRDLSVLKRQQFLHNLLGTTQSVLFEEKKLGDWAGFTDHYARVKIRTRDSINLQNQLKLVRLTTLDGQAVRGELL